MGNNTHLPTERDKRSLTDEEKEKFGAMSPTRFLQKYGKLPSSDDEDDPDYTENPEGPWENGEHLPDEKSPGLRSMDVKKKANDNSGDGNNPTSHVSQAAKIDSNERQSITDVVNPSHFTPSPEELQEERSEESGGKDLEANDVSETDRAETDEELAEHYREKYGHHDSYER